MTMTLYHRRPYHKLAVPATLRHLFQIENAVDYHTFNLLSMMTTASTACFTVGMHPGFNQAEGYNDRRLDWFIVMIELYDSSREADRQHDVVRTTHRRRW